MTSSLSHAPLFKIDESSFRGCCFSSEIGPETSVYVNKKGEVKKFCWFTTFLWSTKHVEDEHCLIRKRILVLVIEHLQNLYDETRGKNYHHYVYAYFLWRAKIDDEIFAVRKEPVTFSLIERIKESLSEATQVFSILNADEGFFDRAIIAKNSNEKNIEQRLISSPCKRPSQSSSLI